MTTALKIRTKSDSSRKPPSTHSKHHFTRPVWEMVVELGSEIPVEDRVNVPDDAAINYKHYLYGASKKKA